MIRHGIGKQGVFALSGSLIDIMIVDATSKHSGKPLPARELALRSLTAIVFDIDDILDGNGKIVVGGMYNLASIREFMVAA